MSFEGSATWRSIFNVRQGVGRKWPAFLSERLLWFIFSARQGPGRGGLQAPPRVLAPAGNANKVGTKNEQVPTHDFRGSPRFLSPRTVSVASSPPFDARYTGGLSPVTPRAGDLERVINYVRKRFICGGSAINSVNAGPSQLKNQPFCPLFFAHGRQLHPQSCALMESPNRLILSRGTAS